MTLSKKQLRELSIDTMASWALDGLEPSAEIVSDINGFIERRMTREEFVAKTKRLAAELDIDTVEEPHER